MNQNDPNHDHDPDPKPDPDNGKATTPSPTGGAFASLQALEAALSGVDLSSVAGRSGLPLMQFKAREGNGTWMFGQKKTVAEDGSLWAVNPLTFRWGYVCFGEVNKVLGENLVPVGKPMPDATKLPDKGFPWKEQWAVNMKCIGGADAGLEVVWKASTDGSNKAVAGLLEAVRDRLNGGQHDGKVAPIVRLEKDSYQHGQFGRVWFPVTPVVDWMPLSGPAPAPTPAAPPPTQQPRRRRVA
jgi:hypothetical protein